VLGGDTGPVRDTVLLNAAAALVAVDADAPAGTLEERLGRGLEQAAQAVDSGAATAVLDRWVAATQ
jgi:anthranilate phosphoribosyltransferase